MTNPKAEHIFWEPYKYKCPNFMTPHVHGYYLIHDGAAEISYGSGFLSGNILWGVTVTRNHERDHDASKVFNSISEALCYVKELRHVS